MSNDVLMHKIFSSNVQQRAYPKWGRHNFNLQRRQTKTSHYTKWREI